jgi:hypothetical protein
MSLELGDMLNSDERKFQSKNEWQEANKTHQEVDP